MVEFLRSLARCTAMLSPIRATFRSLDRALVALTVELPVPNMKVSAAMPMTTPRLRAEPTAPVSCTRVLTELHQSGGREPVLLVGRTIYS